MTNTLSMTPENDADRWTLAYLSGTFQTQQTECQDRNGQAYTLLGRTPDDKYDRVEPEAGSMWRIRFEDGLELDVWGDEIASEDSATVVGTINITPSPEFVEASFQVVMASLSEAHGLRFEDYNGGMDVYKRDDSPITRCENQGELLTFIQGYGAASRRYKLDEERIDELCDEFAGFAKFWDGLSPDQRQRFDRHVHGEVV